MTRYTVGFSDHDKKVCEDMRFRPEREGDYFRYSEVDFGNVFAVVDNEHVCDLINMIRENQDPLPTYPRGVNEWEGDGLRLQGIEYFPAGMNRTLRLAEGHLYLYEYGLVQCLTAGDQLEGLRVRKASQLLGRSVHTRKGVSEWQNAEAATGNIRLVIKLSETGLLKVNYRSRFDCWFDSDVMWLHETDGLEMDVPGVWVSENGFVVRGGRVSRKSISTTGGSSY